MPQWKQMRVLEVVAAIVAETLIENGVMILSDPVEIHWPHGMISKPNPTKHNKKGKKVQKQRHGIFGELVSNLAPTLPNVTSEGEKENCSPAESAPASKRSTRNAKSKKAAERVVHPPTEAENADEESNASHKGLPVQGRRGV